MLRHFLSSSFTALSFDGCPLGSTTTATTLFLALVRQHNNRFGFRAGLGLVANLNVCEQSTFRCLATPPATHASSLCPVRSPRAETMRTMPPSFRLPTVSRMMDAAAVTVFLGVAGRCTGTPSSAIFRRVSAIVAATSGASDGAGLGLVDDV